MTQEYGGWEAQHIPGLGAPPAPAPPQINPFGGGPLPDNFPEQPVIADFTFYDEMGNQQIDNAGFYSATESWYTWAADFAQYSEEGFDGPDQEPAQFLATHAQAVIASVSAELEADRLSLDQAEATFNARMDAFAEAGKQRAEMWKWTVPPGTAGKPLHADIRGSLGMRPWISQPTTIDPFAEAQKIAESFEVSSTPTSDAMQDLINLTGSFLGR